MNNGHIGIMTGQGGFTTLLEGMQCRFPMFFIDGECPQHKQMRVILESADIGELISHSNLEFVDNGCRYLNNQHLYEKIREKSESVDMEKIFKEKEEGVIKKLHEAFESLEPH